MVKRVFQKPTFTISQGGQPPEPVKENDMSKETNFIDWNKYFAEQKAKDKRIKKLETVLREIAKSPQYRHVPNWVVIKCEQALKG